MVENNGTPHDTSSILDSIKYMLGGQPLVDDTNFDPELILHTNGALMIMTQLGVGPKEGFSITSRDQTWQELLLGRTDLNGVFNAVYLRVKLIFDPPTNSFLVAAIKEQIKEYDWRLQEWHNPPGV